MKCRETDCGGPLENGQCQRCGTAEPTDESVKTEPVFASLRDILKPQPEAPTKDDLTKASSMLTTIAPYNYDAWRLHSDLLLNALRQLKTRQLQPDPDFKILSIPLREDDLRDAAEAALRQCAHFADSAEKRTALIDEANSVRRQTWF